jgi:uncharacterized protein DUF6600
VGSMALRVGSASELDINSLGDHDATVTLAQGELNVRLGRLASGDRIEIVTPRGVVDILAAGQYHIDAGTTDTPTRFEVFNGRAELQRDAGNTVLGSGQAALINADATQSLTMASAAPDPLDQWAFARDRGPAPQARTASAAPPAPNYVSPEMTGAADLGAYGNWNTDPQYGAVWYPSDVSANWAPYTDGHWGWVSPWGWTWIDDEPWGFAPFHYGRWAHTGIGWGWAPGGEVETPFYAPALVVFVGSPEHRFFFDRDREGIGWFPLGPREAYVPGYRTSIDYVRNVNRTNVNVRDLNITRVNDRFVVNNGRGDAASNFANHRFATVVPANAFGRSQRVRDIAVHPAAAAATTAASLPVSRDPAATPPRTAGSNGAVNRAAQVNRSGRPPIPVARTATGMQPPSPPAGSSAPGASRTSRTVAGHALPALPPAHGGAATAGAAAVSGNTAAIAPHGGRSAPGPLGAGARTATTNASRGLPAVPPGHGVTPSVSRAGNGATPGAIATTSAPAVRSTRGPLGTSRPSVSNASAGRGLSQLPTNRQQTVKPPAPPVHIAQPPTVPTGSTGSHRGYVAPPTPQVQRNVAAPVRTIAPPPHPAPIPHVAAPARSVAPPPRPAPTPRVAAPVHVAPPAAPARPAGNAAVSHAPAPHPQPAPQPANKDQKRNNNS